MNAWLQWAQSPRRVMITVAALLVVSLLVILMLPARLPTIRSLTGQELAWNLVTPASVDSDVALSVITKRRLWGANNASGLPDAGPGAIDDKPLTPPDWRLVGQFAERGQSHVLVATEGVPQPQVLRAGESLPGGAKILAIHSDHVVLSLNGRRLSLSTYPQ